MTLVYINQDNGFVVMNLSSNEPVVVQQDARTSCSVSRLLFKICFFKINCHIKNKMFFIKLAWDCMLNVFLHAVEKLPYCMTFSRK